MPESNLDARQIANDTKQTVVSLKKYYDDISNILQSADVSQDNVKWLDDNKTITLYGGNKYGNSLVKDGMSRIDHYLEDLSKAVSLNDERWINFSKFGLENEIQYVKDKVTQYNTISTNPDKSVVDWNEIAKGNYDPDIIDAANYLDDVENSLLDSKEYTNNQFLNAKNALANASEANYINNMDEEKLNEALDDILENELDVESVAHLDTIKKDINTKEIFSDQDERKEDLAELINSLREKIEIQQQMIERLEKNYLTNADVTHKSLLTKSAEALSQVQSDLVTFGTDLCGKAANQLSKAYSSAGDIYNLAKTQARETTNNIKSAIAKKAELLTLGGYSKLLNKLEANREAKNFIENLNPNAKIPLKQKIAEVLIKNAPLTSEEVTKSVWKNGKSPIDSAKDGISNIPEKIKEAKKNIKEFIKNDLKKTKEDFTKVKNVVSKEVFKTCAGAIELYVDNTKKAAGRIEKKMQKYQKIDKALHDAKENIAKELNSLTSITPYKKADYTTSTDMKAKLDVMKSYQNISDIDDMSKFSKDLRDLSKKYADTLTNDAINDASTVAKNTVIGAKNAAINIKGTYLIGAEAIYQKRIDNLHEKFNTAAITLAGLQEIIEKGQEKLESFREKAGITPVETPVNEDVDIDEGINDVEIGE